MLTEFHLKTKKVKIVIFLLFLFYIFFCSHIIFEQFLKIECPFLKYLHVFCPGCGITRMFISIINLDFYQAFRYNSLLFIFFIIFIIYFILSLFINIKLSKKQIFKLSIILLSIVLIYGILRNIPAFAFLAPTEI